MSDTERFLDEVTSAIPDKRTRENVKAELRAHVEEKKEEYIFYGYSPEEAEKKAIGEMGNRRKLTRELGEVNSFFSLKRFKDALTLFYFGFWLASFYMDVWYFKEITTGIGCFLMLAASFLCRKSNRELFAAFIVSVVHIFFFIAYEMLSVLPPVFGTWFLQAMLAVIQGLLVVRMFLFSYGISRFSEGKAAKEARQCGYLYLVATGAVYIGILLSGGIPSFLFLLLFILTIILILRRIRHVNRDIWKNDREVKMEKLGKTGVAALCILICCSILLPTVTAYSVTAASPKNVTASYSATDLNGEEAERAEAVREKILESMDKEVTKDVLGDSVNMWVRAVENIKQSDLLRLDTEDFIAHFFNVGFGIFTYDMMAAHGDGSATLLSIYIYYRDTETATRAAQRAYVVEGCTVLQEEAKPVRFMQFYAEGDRTTCFSSSYEYVGEDRVGNEFKRIRGKEQYGYALFDFKGAAVNYYNYQVQQTSFYRSPYNYSYLESYPETVGKGWLLMVDGGYKIQTAIP